MAELSVEAVKLAYLVTWREKDKAERYQRLRYFKAAEAREHLSERWEKDDEGKYRLIELVPMAGKSFGGA
jgi:hypothetical protein